MSNSQVCTNHQADIALTPREEPIGAGPIEAAPLRCSAIARRTGERCRKFPNSRCFRLSLPRWRSPASATGGTQTTR